jgi:lipid-binding SYLF domain-containing protein
VAFFTTLVLPSHPRQEAQHWPEQNQSRLAVHGTAPSVKKGAFGIGGSYGRGVMICRSGEHYTGLWGPPAMYALEGVNIGFQLGGEATDFILLVMNPKRARSLLSSKVKLGAAAMPLPPPDPRAVPPKPPPTSS